MFEPSFLRECSPHPPPSGPPRPTIITTEHHSWDQTVDQTVFVSKRTKNGPNTNPLFRLAQHSFADDVALPLQSDNGCWVDRIACAGVENRGKKRKSTKRCGLDRLNLIYAKRALVRPPNGLPASRPSMLIVCTARITSPRCICR